MSANSDKSTVKNTDQPASGDNHLEQQVWTTPNSQLLRSVADEINKSAQRTAKLAARSRYPRERILKHA
ncbi:hypothetical protein SARC_02616 [Sphaeroforma arctica JP610]|uniref:Uncharacterized protein n=1 Tax=Sphaeroforma arctica JP610 TaxID=667725 RepID=A0A0L0G838_9EUKA|nr:hypothetical protein SARC_02616 [Sphaeroforma arctica JP610]KNC85197.1 hypothetical protein SARC_02616 [Sphaeroforma arctica JP610]|eukprot:XP_014159099.1 hypothetical protein SARC_02616 [Sphaeroforma arctica JP610]